MIPEWVFLRRRVLLDSNLLAVMTVGLTDQSLLGEGLAKGFDGFDFDLIAGIVAYCDETISTPYILAEVNSLLNKTGYAREQCRAVLATAIVPGLVEQYHSSLELSNEVFLVSKFGLTDASIVRASQRDIFVVTTDGPLCGYLKSTGVAALHYDDIRYLAKTLQG